MKAKILWSCGLMVAIALCMALRWVVPFAQGYGVMRYQLRGVDPTSVNLYVSLNERAIGYKVSQEKSTLQLEVCLYDRASGGVTITLIKGTSSFRLEDPLAHRGGEAWLSIKGGNELEAEYYQTNDF